MIDRWKSAQIRGEEVRARKKFRPKNRMRSGASHPGPHRSCIPDLPLSPRRRRNDGFSPTAPAQASAAFAKASLPTHCLATAIQQPCGGQWPFFCSEEQKGEEAASPGTQSRKRVSECFPPAIHSRELPVTAGFAAIIRPSQELSRFAPHTLRHFLTPRKSKKTAHCAEPVDAETSLWKPEEI